MFQIVASEKGSVDFTELQQAKKVAELISSVFPLLSIAVVEPEGHTLAQYECGEDVGDPALDVPLIPRSITHSGPPIFTKKIDEERWLVLGNEVDLRQGATIPIRKRGTTPEKIVVGKVVAARPYLRSTGRLVAVTFENVPWDPDAPQA